MTIRISILALILIVAGTSCQRERRRDSELPITQRMSLAEMDGTPISFNQYQGRTLFINVWATWCKPCIEEMPSIRNAQNLLRGKDIEFLFASDEDKERVEAFAVERNLELHFVRLLNLEEVGIQVLPMTFIVNSKGRVVFSEAGYRKWDDPMNIEMLTRIEGTNE